MKQLNAMFLSLLLLLSLASCGTPEESPQPTPSASSSAEETTVETTASQFRTTSIPTSEEPTEPTEFDPLSVQRHNVDSTCFSTIGYDAAQEVLVVQFRTTGSVYTYSEFSQSEYDAFMQAASLGSYYNKHIKGQYPCERIK